MSDNEGWKLVSFDLMCFRWFWRNEVKCYVSVQVTYLLDITFFPFFYITLLYKITDFES